MHNLKTLQLIWPYLSLSQQKKILRDVKRIQARYDFLECVNKQVGAPFIESPSAHWLNKSEFNFLAIRTYSEPDNERERERERG